MVTVPLTTSQAFIVVIRSIGQLVAALARDVRHFCQVHSRGYEFRNYEWRGDFAQQSKEDNE